MKRKIVIISNIPSPYRIDFFWHLQQTLEDKLCIIYSAKSVKNRNWKIDENKLGNTYFLKSKTLYLRKSDRHIFIPYGVRTLLKKINPDIIVGMEYNPTILEAVKYCKTNKIPYVSWTDGTFISERKLNLLQKWSRSHVINFASSFIASSTKSKELQLSYGALEEKIFISYLTVDISQIKGRLAAKKKNQILCVGSLTPRKGIDLLLEALAEVKTEYQLVLAGEGPEESSLKQLANKLGIEKKVFFAGFLDREALYHLYAESELFVLTTREDCFALVILEAIAARLPVICSKYADGAYDLIENGKNGIIIDPYNRLELAGNIEKVFMSKTIQNQMSTESEKVLEKFEFEKCAQGFMNAIHCAEE